MGSFGGCKKWVRMSGRLFMRVFTVGGIVGSGVASTVSGIVGSEVVIIVGRIVGSGVGTIVG